MDNSNLGVLPAWEIELEGSGGVANNPVVGMLKSIYPLIELKPYYYDFKPVEVGLDNNPQISPTLEIELKEDGGRITRATIVVLYRRLCGRMPDPCRSNEELIEELKLLGGK